MVQDSRTGRKWKQVASQKEKIRYVVCNGDEGDSSILWTEVLWRVIRTA